MKGVVRKTTKGRVVYDRPRHDFTWKDAFRLISRGLGMPRYENAHIAMMSGSPRAKLRSDIPVPARDAEEYCAMILTVDAIAQISAAMPTGSFDAGVLTTAYSQMSPEYQRKYARVREIYMSQLLTGLAQLAESLL